MYNLDGWREVPCAERDQAYDLTLRPLSSLTDPDGIYGPPVIYTEWGLGEHPVLRDYRTPGGRCRHYLRT